MNHELDMDRIIDRDPRHNRRIRSGLPHREEPDSLRKFPKERRQFFKAGSRRQKSLFTICKNVTRYITYTHSYNEVKMHSYKYSLLGVVAAVAMSLTAIAPASAEPIASSNPSPNSITLSAEDKMEISDILTSYGVDEEKAQYLVSRYEHGYAWDSFTPGSSQ